MLKDALELLLDFVKIFYTKGVWSFVILFLYLLGLGYLLLPSPMSIDDFPALPDATTSQLEGDTIQNPNIAAYFSNFRREYITKYYWDYLKDWSYLGIKLPLFKINHPPERAYTFIRDQQESTALEEYYIPFKGSFFVNIYDPIIYNQIRRRPITDQNSYFVYEGGIYDTKTTLRYYPTSVFGRVLTYVLTIFSVYLLIRLSRKYLKG